mmetsp:Transcript_97615/g.252451  ORF Transcript_97615/g.252451 Transcript_97615/m.252451 type:complete len:971 (-) Transcript_97615:397-3309(-)
MPDLTPEQEEFLQQQAFDQGTKVAQIFSGIFFSGLAAWLSTTNGTRLSFVQKASLEKRLTVCCFLNIYVAMFSAFFNVFQLTDVDDAILPETGDFVLDLSRPIEWVLTCPLMQLTLVLMGGAKIPEYRRYVMPLFSVVILTFGFTSTIMPNTVLKLLCYACGVCLFGAMVFFNRVQIIEYSGGYEGLLSGDSEFRKATLLLISTWFPFPAWFIMSPEGFGLIDNVLIIQVGWAFLNIVAKFVFIFYIQRIKDMYCNRLKTKREMGTGNKGGARHGAVSPPDFDFSGGMVPNYDDAQAYEQNERDRKKEKLGAIVVETMSFLGMAQNTDRFQRLLDNANIVDLDQVEALTKEECEKIQLPFDLVSALQRRVQVWKLEMVDDAEMGLERGEEHYLKKILDMPKMEPMDMGQQRYMPNGMQPVQLMPNMVPGGPSYVGVEAEGGIASGAQSNAGDIGRMVDPAAIEEMLQKAENNILEGQKSRVQSWEKALEGIYSKLESRLEATEKRISERVAEHLDATSKAVEVRNELRAFENRMNLKFDDVAKAREQRNDMTALEKRLGQQIEQQIGLAGTKVDACCQKVELCLQKVETCNSVQTGQQSEGFAKLTAQLDESSKQTRSGIEAMLKCAEALQVQQAKIASDSEYAWRQKFEEFENSMVCREDEHEALSKKRYDELVRLSAAKRLDDLLSQIQKMGERHEIATEGLGSNINGELQVIASRLAQKVDALQVAGARQNAELEGNLQKRFHESLDQAVAQGAQAGALETAQRAEKSIEALDESMQKRLQQIVEQAVTQGAQRGALETAARAEKCVETLDNSLNKRLQQAVEDAVTQAAHQGSLHGAQRAEKAVESLESGLQRRLDEAFTRATTEAVHHGIMTSAHRVEKSVEALEATHRNDLSSAMNNLVERVDDIQATQMRKLNEREERQARRVEELLELSANRSVQKTEDVGMDLKKELHGFAKRLNTKIPFM